MCGDGTREPNFVCVIYATIILAFFYSFVKLRLVVKMSPVRQRAKLGLICEIINEGKKCLSSSLHTAPCGLDGLPYLYLKICINALLQRPSTVI